VIIWLVTYNRLGQQTVGIHEYNGIEITSYDPNTLLPVSKTIGYLGQPNKYMYYTHDSLGRQTGYKLSASYLPDAEGLSEVSYSFDDYGRFHSVSSSVDSVSSVVDYSYLENSSLIAGYTSPNGFEVTKSYEPNRNLIVGISNYFGANSISSFEYQNDAIGRRSQRIDNNSENLFAITNSFAYNHYSEVTNAIMNTDDYNFTFDDIGNREEFQVNTTSVDYENSPLNQCIEANSSNPAYDKSFAFDLDGNMVTNGTWCYTWNAENRMTSASNTVDDAYITYAYDYQGRMVGKKLEGRSVNGEIEEKETLYYWNGVNIIAELTTQQSNSLTNYYTWANGETLIASLDGETVFYCHDANKNVTDLVDDTGDLVAHYEYSPFGVITAQTGTLVDDNPFRFSNEYWDNDLKKIAYLFRFYDPSLGKFLSRDPIGEKAGQNLYLMCLNDPIGWIDILGLQIPSRKCSVDIYFGHSGDSWNPNGEEEFGKCQWVGYGVCWGNNQNKKIPKDHLIPGIPDQPGTVPVPDETVPFDEQVKTAAKYYAGFLCAGLKQLDSCCGETDNVEGKTDKDGNPVKKKCCSRCTLNFYYDKDPLTPHYNAENIRLIRNSWGKVKGLKDEIKNSCPGLSKKAQNIWGDGLPTLNFNPSSHSILCEGK